MKLGTYLSACTLLASSIAGATGGEIPHPVYEAALACLDLPRWSPDPSLKLRIEQGSRHHEIVFSDVKYPGKGNSCPCKLTITQEGARLQSRDGQVVFEGRDDATVREFLLGKIEKFYSEAKSGKLAGERAIEAIHRLNGAFGGMIALYSAPTLLQGKALRQACVERFLGQGFPSGFALATGLPSSGKSSAKSGIPKNLILSTPAKPSAKSVDLDSLAYANLVGHTAWTCDGEVALREALNGTIDKGLYEATQSCRAALAEFEGEAGQIKTVAAVDSAGDLYRRSALIDGFRAAGREPAVEADPVLGR